MLVRIAGCFLLIGLFALAGCGGTQSSAGDSGAIANEPDYITVQHILIGFAGSVDGKNITRSKEEAEALAMEIYQRAKAGEDFDMLVEEYTDDSAPGLYGMANHGATPDKDREIYARKAMVQYFGDVSFSLTVGEVGLAKYDKDKCKYGWHIVLRIK
jgi:hypothetical protein